MKPGSVLSSYLELVDDNACFDKTSPEEYNIPSHKTPPNEDAKVAISHLQVEVEVEVETEARLHHVTQLFTNELNGIEGASAQARLSL